VDRRRGDGKSYGVALDRPKYLPYPGPYAGICTATGALHRIRVPPSSPEEHP
jgi:hypothetical protein